MVFRRLLVFPLNSKHSYRMSTRVVNRLDPDQARRFVRPDLDPTCLQRLSADATSRQRGELKIKSYYLFIRSRPQTIMEATHPLEQKDMLQQSGVYELVGIFFVGLYGARLYTKFQASTKSNPINIKKTQVLLNRFVLVPVCTPKYKMRLKAPPHKHKQLKIGLFWCLFVHRSTKDASKSTTP